MIAESSTPIAPDPGGADVLIAIDVGTSGARASGYDVYGTLRQEVRRSYPTSLPAEGWAEQDANQWRTASLAALAALVRSLGGGSRVRAIAVTGQCPSVVPLDGRDRPLRPGLIYRDNRASSEAAWMREHFGDRELHKLTGHVPAAFHVAAKIMWIRAHEADVFAATRRFVQPTDYVALSLTCENAAGPPNCSQGSISTPACCPKSFRRGASPERSGPRSRAASGCQPASRSSPEPVTASPVRWGPG
jgi:sugar (pentulose or hexulose) kinase